MTEQLNRRIFYLLEELTPIPDLPEGIDALLQAQQWANNAHFNFAGKYRNELGRRIKETHATLLQLHSVLLSPSFANLSHKHASISSELDNLTNKFTAAISSNNLIELELTCNSLITLEEAITESLFQETSSQTEYLFNLSENLDSIRYLCATYNLAKENENTHINEIFHDSITIKKLIAILHTPLFNSATTWPDFDNFMADCPNGFNEVSNLGVNASAIIRAIADNVRDNILWDFGESTTQSPFDCSDRHQLSFRLRALAHKIDELGITEAFGKLNDALLGVPSEMQSFVERLQAEQSNRSFRAA